MARHALWRAAGFPAGELDRPFVAVLAARQPFSPHGGEVGARARSAALGVQGAGGNPRIFDLAGAGAQADFGDSLEWQDVAALALQVERIGRAFSPQALVLVADTGASLLGLLRGAARLDLPAVALPGEGSPLDPSWPGLMDFAASYVRGKISREEWTVRMEREMGLPGFAAAASNPDGFKHLVEAAGLSLPGASTAQAGSAAFAGLARSSGWQAVTLAHMGQRLSQMLSPAALRNALALDSSLGGSVEAAWGLAQVAGELGAPLSRSWLEAPKARAYLAPQADAGLWHAEGGVLALQLLLWEAGAQEDSARGVTRKNLKDLLGDCVYPEEPRAFLAQPGGEPATRLFLLKGPLAPRGVLLKAPRNCGQAALTARVFADEEDACRHALKHGGEGEILVLRTGGRRIRVLGAALRAAESKAWVLADGPVDGPLPGPAGFRLPGAPGAWEGLRDGEAVRLDPGRGLLEGGAAPAGAAGGEQEGWAALEWSRLGKFGFVEG